MRLEDRLLEAATDENLNKAALVCIIGMGAGVVVRSSAVMLPFAVAFGVLTLTHAKLHGFDDEAADP